MPCCADVCSSHSSAELFPDKRQPGLEILHVNWTKISLSPRGLSHTSTYTPPLLSSMSLQIRSSITFAPKTCSPCVRITPQNVDRSREAGESTHTAWVVFSATSSRTPCDAVGREVPTHSWHVGLRSAAGGVRGSLTCPLASPPLARGERERGCFRHRGPDILLYPHFLIQGPFTDWWQRGYSSSKFLPSCFQAAGKEVSEYTEEEECDWGKCQ